MIEAIYSHGEIRPSQAIPKDWTEVENVDMVDRVALKS